MNKFEWVNDSNKKVNGEHDKLPKRSTAKSAGYDFFSLEEITVAAHSKSALHFTDVKVQLDDDKVLLLFPRSSFGMKGLRLANTTGIIDSDYYGNEKNDGNIGFSFINDSDEPLTIKKGEHFMQGIIVSFYKTDDDNTDAKRVGGFGSTSEVK